MGIASCCETEFDAGSSNGDLIACSVTAAKTEDDKNTPAIAKIKERLKKQEDKEIICVMCVYGPVKLKS